MVHRFPLPYCISPGESQAVPEVNIPSLKASTSKWQTSCQMTPMCTTKIYIWFIVSLSSHTPAWSETCLYTVSHTDQGDTRPFKNFPDRTTLRTTLSSSFEWLCCHKQLWMKEVQNSSMEAVNFLQTWLRLCCGELHTFLAFSKAKRSHVSCNSAELCAIQNTIENCFHIPAEVELR